MSMRFSTQNVEDGGYEVVATSEQNVTYLVCECETEELAGHLVNEFNVQEPVEQQDWMVLSDMDEVEDIEVEWPRLPARG